MDPRVIAAMDTITNMVDINDRRIATAMHAVDIIGGILKELAAVGRERTAIMQRQEASIERQDERIKSLEYLIKGLLKSRTNVTPSEN